MYLSLPLRVTLAASLLVLAGCGKAAPVALTGSGPTRKLAPVAAQGAVSVATRNTTRLGGANAADDAAAVARAVYPGLTASTRPAVVAVVDERDWPAALAASVLSSAPTNAPLVYAQGETLPAVSSETLEAMHPLGDSALGGAQVIRIGTGAALPSGELAYQVVAGTPAATAAELARLAVKLDGTQAPHAAIVLGLDASPALAMPAAGLAAESGAPILFVTPAGVPAATASALAALHQPSIYVIDAAALPGPVLGALRRLGRVKAIPTGVGATPGQAAVQNAIEVARFTSGTFGWGVKEPGHGLVFANASSPFDGPAAALLSATGDFGPLLLLEGPTRVPAALARYLSDIQPAYSGTQFPAVRGAYNHGWVIGDEAAISAVTQAEIDSMLEIVPRPQTAEESSAATGE